MALVVVAPSQLYQLPLVLIFTTCRIPPHRLPIINNPSNNPTNEPSSAPANAPASAPSSRSNNTKATTNTTITDPTPSESSSTDSDLTTPTTSYSAPLGVTADDDTKVVTNTTITTNGSSDLPLIITASVATISSIVFFVLSRRNDEDE